MRLNYIFPALLLAATVGLTGCFPVFLEPLENPPPRARPVVADNYEKFEFIAATRKTLLLNEEFNDNTRGWREVLHSPDYTIEISGGELYMFTRNTFQQNSISFPELKSTDNFEIEVLMKVDNTTSDFGNRLLWGAGTNPLAQACFYEINDAYYNLVRAGYEDGPVYSAEYYEVYYPDNAYNKFTVRKVKNTCYYFINGTYIGKQPFNAFFGPRIGFEAGFYTTLQVEYLKVVRLSL